MAIRFDIKKNSFWGRACPRWLISTAKFQNVEDKARLFENRVPLLLLLLLLRERRGEINPNRDAANREFGSSFAAHNVLRRVNVSPLFREIWRRNDRRLKGGEGGGRVDEANVLKECFETPPPTPPQQQGKARRQVSSSLDFFPIFFFFLCLFSLLLVTRMLSLFETL